MTAVAQADSQASWWRRTPARVVLVLGVVATALGMFAAVAPAVGPPGPIQEDGCIAHNASQWLCGWGYPGNGLSGGTPVLDVHSVRVGFLHKGENWILCQQPGRSVKVPVLNGQTDFHESTAMWAWTEADNRHWGWASEAYGDWGLGSPGYVFPGWPGVPSCNGARGPTPGGPGAPPRKPPPKPRPPVSPNGCLDTKEDQWVTVRYRFLEIHQIDHTNNGTPGTPPLITNQKPPAYHDFAKLQINASTCQKPSGGWRVLKQIAFVPNSFGLRDDDPGLPTGKGSTKGWGITVKSYRNGTLSVGALACIQKTRHLWAGVKLLLGIPIPPTRLLTPAASYTISVAQWVAGLLAPGDRTKTKCGDLGTEQLTISADHNGHLRVTNQVATPDHPAPIMYGISEWTPYVLQFGRPTYYQLYERAIQPPRITPGR